SQGFDTFLEIGPDRSLTALATLSFPGDDCLFVPSLRPGDDDWRSVLAAAGELFVHGLDLEWERGQKAGSRATVEVPFYAFHRRRHWLDLGSPRAVSAVTPMQTQTPSLNNGITVEVRDLLAETGGFRPAELTPAQNLM